MTTSTPRTPRPPDPSGETAASEIVSAVQAIRSDPRPVDKRPPAADEGGSIRTMTGSSLYELPISDADRSLQTLSLSNLRGADHAEDLKGQLAGWHRAFTSHNARPRFLLDKRIGEGAQGVIFGVIDRDCRRTVALKTLHSSGVDATEVSRFIHEAQITAQLEHPGIVPVHDFGALPDGTVFYTMKRVEGESLAAYMQDRSGEPKHRFDLVQLFVRVCETVGFAHSRGVIHRDLKPRNIMVGAFGEVLVMDWGLAKIMGDDRGRTTARVTSLRQDGGPSGSDVHRTLEGFAVGTPAYMSPEQARGESDRVDQRSDLYSLGVILYEMLSGQSPYERGDVRKTLEQVAAGRMTRLEELEVGEGIDRSLRAITHKAMAVKREDRYASVAALVKDLRDHLAGLAVSAHRESLFERAQRLYRRHRRPLLAALTVAVVAIVGFTAWWASNEYKRAATIGNHRRIADERASHDGIPALEEARYRLGLLLELAPADRPATLALASVEARLEEARARQQLEGMRAQRRADAIKLLEAATPLTSSDDVAELDAASKRVLQAIGLVQDDGEASVLRERCDVAYEALVTRRVQIEERERVARETAAQAEADRRRRAEADARLDALAADIASGDLVRAATRLAEARTIDEQHPRLVECERRIAEAETDRLHAQAAAQAERRSRDCLARLDEARVALADAERLGTQREIAERRVDALTSRLLQQGDIAVRAELAEAETVRDDAARGRDQALSRGYDLLHDAERTSPGRREVCATLAAFFLARADEADAVGDRATSSSQLAQAKAWATTAGDASFSLDATVVVPATAPAVTLSRITTSAERIDVANDDGVRVQPGAKAAFAKGRWLARSDAGAIAAVRLERGHVTSLGLRPPPTLPTGTVYVPPGRVWGEHGRPVVDADGDEIVVAPFAVMTNEVTCGEYLEFLNDQATLLAYEKSYMSGVLRLCPRSGLRDESLWRKKGAAGSSAGQFQLASNERDSQPIDPRLPVSGLSFEDALEYARWKAARDGVAWRLPTRLEWQLAAQGGDGRAYPWGDRADLTRCYSLVVAAGDLVPQRRATIARTVGSFPADCSVQGAYDLAGSLSEFVMEDASDPRWASLMGGSFATRDPDRFASWSRRWVDPRHADLAHGFRLVATVE